MAFFLSALTLSVATSRKSTSQPGIREIDRLEDTRLGEQVIQGMVGIRMRREREGRIKIEKVLHHLATQVPSSPTLNYVEDVAVGETQEYLSQLCLWVQQVVEA